MSYTLSNLQLCSICKDESNYINTSLEHPTIDKETLLKRKAKLLKCNHLFHHECINKFFFDGGMDCPVCKIAIDKEERYFSLIKVSHILEKENDRYIKLDENGPFEIFIPKNISEKDREMIFNEVTSMMLEKPAFSISLTE